MTNDFGQKCIYCPVNHNRSKIHWRCWAIEDFMIDLQDGGGSVDDRHHAQEFALFGIAGSPSAMPCGNETLLSESELCGGPGS